MKIDTEPLWTQDDPLRTSSVALRGTVSMTRVEELLKDYRVALDDSHKRGAKAVDPVNYPATLDLLERMMIEVAGALLVELGEVSRPGESEEDMIERAGAAVRDHGECFVDGASINFMAQQIVGFNQCLRDINYLREGFGRGIGRSKGKPPDMKWSHGGAIESYVRDTVHRITEELKSDGAELHRLTPEVHIDLGEAHRGIEELLQQGLDERAFMTAVIDLGHRLTGAAGWDSFSDLPYKTELQRRSSFFLEVITREPPKSPLAGFYVEIAYPSRQGKTVADLDVTGSDSYERGEEEWFARINYTPKDSYAHSDVLAAIYRLAYAPGGLGNAADYTMSLAWGTYFARACARRYLADLGSDFVGLRVGFSGGDWIDLGWVRPS